MKRFFVLCMLLSLAAAFVGGEMKAEIKKETTVTTPEGTSTTTDTQKVETSGENPSPAAKSCPGCSKATARLERLPVELKLQAGSISSAIIPADMISAAFIFKDWRRGRP